MKEIKELKFSPVIEGHDIEVRVARAKDFMEKGHNVKLTVQRKGRQTREQSREIMRQLLTIFSDYSTIEPEPKEDGPKLSITIKADGKTKNNKTAKKRIRLSNPKGNKKSKMLYKKTAQHHLRTKLSSRSKRRKLPREVVNPSLDKKLRAINI
jgi:ribosomal protein L35